MEHLEQKGVAEGATLLSGGKRPAELQQGYYLQPTIFTGVTPNMTIWREEIFGPVLSAATFTYVLIPTWALTYPRQARSASMCLLVHSSKLRKR